MSRRHPDGVTAYPLKWPEGWPRTADHKRVLHHPFKSARHSMTGVHRSSITFDRARRDLSDELGRLGAEQVVMSSDLPLRLDGQPYADAVRRRMDPGVAVYFFLKGRPMVMAQDRYADMAANVRSLALAIEAMRALERHGGGTMMERAFSGFSALPPPEGHKARRPWWEVLRYSADPADREILTADEIDARFRSLARRAHPDAGGSHEEMSELNGARDDALAELKGES